MGLRHGAIDCHKCGIPAALVDHITGTGSCLDCAQLDLVANLIGLSLPESMEYKRWKVAYQISTPGRPRITTPTAAQAASLPSKVLSRIVRPWS